MESGLSFGAKLLVSVLGARRRNETPIREGRPGRDVPGGPGETGKKEGKDDGDAADERDDEGQG